jgi:hypothetical protein
MWGVFFVFWEHWVDGLFHILGIYRRGMKSQKNAVQKILANTCNFSLNLLLFVFHEDTQPFLVEASQDSRWHNDPQNGSWERERSHIGVHKACFCCSLSWPECTTWYSCKLCYFIYFFYPWSSGLHVLILNTPYYNKTKFLVIPLQILNFVPCSQKSSLFDFVIMLVLCSIATTEGNLKLN